jgi:lysyl oxidase
MRFWSTAIMAVALLSACARDATELRTYEGRPGFAHDSDLVGEADLIVDAHILGSSWVVYNETIFPGCTAEEGDVTPGDHRTLRFSVNTPNIGTADLVVGDPNKHYDPNGDGNPADSDGLFELATCHGHYHFRNYARYELYPVLANGDLGPVIHSAKRGFCMLDIAPGRADPAPTKSWMYRSCGRPRFLGLPPIAGNQGVSAGWADEYTKWLAGQFFVVDNLPGGAYLLRVVVNPAFVGQAGEPCPHTDSQGLCHMLPESNYANNVGEVRITLPEGRTGKKGWGPGGGEELPSYVNANTDDQKKQPNK